MTRKLVSEHRIPNHASAKLSAMDMSIVLSVPPGGNWKDVPVSIPSKRLQTIRDSYKAGLGSRSTYYGRLHPDRPSYTINTYFTRPGNGCHIHYDYAGGQHRVISYREAARLQSFPDAFEFVGSGRAVAIQIGNAVPPLLAYQIALTLGKPGLCLDLFAGAGGLGLGFKWAGWQSVVANDIDAKALESFRNNVHKDVLLGDIQHPDTTKELIRRCRAARRQNTKPFWILGGPPCQGFSTAGKPRTMEDNRNQLFWSYRDLVEELKPDGFVFENVSGLLNMDGGRVYQLVKDAFSTVMPNISGWVLSTAEHAVPQRRTRVILVGTRTKQCEPPSRISALDPGADLFADHERVVSVKEALCDLPALHQGQNGVALPYRSEPSHPYQALMRGVLSPAEYLARVTPKARQAKAG